MVRGRVKDGRPLVLKPNNRMKKKKTTNAMVILRTVDDDRVIFDRMVVERDEKVQLFIDSTFVALSRHFCQSLGVLGLSQDDVRS